VEAFQFTVNVVGCPVEAVAGEASTGVAGGAGGDVVKLRIASRTVPALFWPATRK
jgi:hypothetical protein